MRTPVVSLLCGLLALSSGAAVTNRVKIAVAVPAAAVVKSVTVASNAVPASVSVAPVSPVQLAQRIEVILSSIGPVDTASIAEAFVAAIEKAEEAELAKAVSIVFSRTTPSEFIAIVTRIFHSVGESERAKLLVAVFRQTAPSEFATIVAEVMNARPSGKRMSVLVEALGICRGAEAVKALLPVISEIDAANEDVVVIVSVMEAMARAIREDVPVSVARAAKEANRIDAPQWYDIRLYDGGTGLWAIAMKAKWHAEHGDHEKVDQLYAYFLKVMSNVESNR